MNKQIAKAIEDQLNITQRESQLSIRRKTTTSCFNTHIDNNFHRRWSNNKRKRGYSNKLSLYLNNLKSINAATQILHNFDINFNSGLNIIENEINKQTDTFRLNYENKLKFKKSKKINFSPTNKTNSRKSSLLSTPIQNKNKNYLINPNNKFESIFQEFIKKFYFVFFSQCFDKPLEITKKTHNEVFLNKIDKYFSYEDQIKQFEMLNLNEEGKINYYLILNIVYLKIF